MKNAQLYKQNFSIIWCMTYRAYFRTKNYFKYFNLCVCYNFIV